MSSSKKEAVFIRLYSFVWRMKYSEHTSSMIVLKVNHAAKLTISSKAKTSIDLERIQNLHHWTQLVRR
jgi:hypothetical protein